MSSTAHSLGRLLGTALVGVALLGYLSFSEWQERKRFEPAATSLRESAAVLIGRYNDAHGTQVSVPGVAFVGGLGGPPARLIYGGVEFDQTVVAGGSSDDLLRTLCHELAHHVLNSRLGAFHEGHADDGSADFVATFAELRRFAGLKS